MIVVELSPSEEEELTARDEAVKQKLLLAMQDAERQMEEAQATLSLVRDATRQEHWWKLRGILSQKEIESLCNISPVDLLASDEDES